jgi:TonB family protein
VKHHDPKNPKRKNFLRIPTFPGGKEAYLNFITANILYPESALENNVEGDVYVKYTVNNIGEVVDVEITKGIGSGCDEEAERVIRLLKYEPARNRGVKMKVEMKTRISFHLPKPVQNEIQNGLQYNYITTNDSKAISPNPKNQGVYSYSINIG